MDKIKSNGFNTYQDFVDFITKHPEITTRTQFKNTYGNLYNKFISLKFKLGHPEWELPIGSKRNLYNLNLDYSSLSDFQKYIDDNEIHGPNEFKTLNKSLKSRMDRLGFSRKVIYVGKINTYLLNMPEKIQKFLTDNKISSRKMLKEKYLSIYRKLLKFEKRSDYIFRFFTKLTESNYERQFKNELEKRGILNFLTQVRISEEFRVDFLIDNRIIIEIHGEQHFNTSLVREIWECDFDILEKDKAKRDFAKNLGYEYYYFTYAKECFEEFGYFDKVFTDLDELFNKLNLPIECYSEETPIMENFIPEDESVDMILIKKLNTLDKILNFIQDNKIESPEQLIKEYKTLYYNLENRGWVNKLYYYIKPGEVGSMKNYKCKEDVQNFINKFKITNVKNFRKIAFRLYNKAWRFKWLSSLKFYQEGED